MEGKICSNFRQSKNPLNQIKIDSDVYCMSEDGIIDILTKYNYDAEKYRKKKKHPNMLGRKRKFDEKIAMKLYQDGKNDSEMAEILKIKIATVYYWRRQNNLEVKRKKPHSNATK